MTAANPNRLIHLRAVEDDYPSMVMPWVADDCPRWLAVSITVSYDHAEYGCQLFETRDAALKAFAEACANGDAWAPHVLYDLDTGARFVLDITVTAREPGT